LIDVQPLGVEFSKGAIDEFNKLLGGPTYDSFRKCVDPMHPANKRHIEALRHGETWKDISWKNRIEDPSAMTRLSKVLRSAVWRDLKDAFDAIEPKVCNWCGSEDGLVPDHDDPSFEAIRNEWVIARGMPDITDAPRGIGKMLADIDVEADWVAFHASRAVYQILCGSCNSKKGHRGMAYLASVMPRPDKTLHEQPTE